MERKLASVQRIIKLEPVLNSDRLDVATVLGWKVVVKRGEFKEGDPCVYVEVDSVLPERPEFEFLRDRKFKVKTIRLRGQISQGIVFPLGILPSDLDGSFFNEGVDVTDVLGIKKYEPTVPTCLSGVAKGPFPSFIPKTDEIRIQASPGFLERNAGKDFYVTEKLDGTSCSLFIRDGQLSVCSRNLELVRDEKIAYWKCAFENDLERKLLDAENYVMGRLAVQGEMIGPGVQGNKYGRSKLEFYVFNIYAIDKDEYLDFWVMGNICEKFGFNHVPVLVEGSRLPETVDECVSMSTGISRLCARNREGIVIRCMGEEWSDPETGRLSFKVINPEFLLEHGE